MESRARGLLLVAVLMAAGIAACARNSTSPSPATTTTTTAAATTTVAATTTAATTTVPATATTFLLNGVISGSDTKKGISGAEVEILTGPVTGAKSTTDANGVYAFPGLSGGNYGLRARAATYDLIDFQAAITNANVAVNVEMNKTPTTTTTSIGPLTAVFTSSPDPCQLTSPAVACTVDASGSSSAAGINLYTWTYLGRTATGVTHNLQLSCGDGPEQTVHIPVTLTLTESGGATASISKSITVVKSGVCGFP